MASRADERMVLDTTGRDGVVRRHVCQDQLSATGTTTHYSHSDGTHLPSVIPHYWRCLSFVQDCKRADDFIRADCTGLSDRTRRSSRNGALLREAARYACPGAVLIRNDR